MSENNLNPYLKWLAIAALLGLFVLGLAWELFLAPLRPGGSLLALKVLPLILPLTGLWRGKLYTFQWSAMLILLYLMEGTVRMWSDISLLSERLALIETILALVFYFSAIFYVRPAKRAAKQRLKQS